MPTDVISKNGNFLLNVELMGDGTIPIEHKLILDKVGEWVNLYSDAIYGGKLWKEQMDLARKSGIAAGVSNGWEEYIGLNGLDASIRSQILKDIINL